MVRAGVAGLATMVLVWGGCCGAARCAGTRQSAAAQPAAEAMHPPRPRMLIGERDPLTGFHTLRARYRAGARPSDDMAGWALTYLLTGRDAPARRAVEEMRRTRPPATVDSRTYSQYVTWSLAFDWLRDYADFDAALKDRVAGELFEAARQMLDQPSLKTPEQTMYHNRTMRYLALAMFALTAIEGHAPVEARAAPMREHARRAWEHVLDLTSFITPEGGYHESMDYQRITYAAMALMAELDRTTRHRDPALRYPVFRHYTTTYLYKVLPDGTTARDDDNEFPFLGSEVPSLGSIDHVVLGYAIHRFKDPYAAWILRDSGWLGSATWLIPITEFLWNDPLVTPRDPARSTEAELSRQHFFRGIGHLVMRDGWGPSSTWVQFNSGPYLAKHDHLDQNHFVIYHKGHLAPESGADYTDTESPHYLNYYRRTIAHNTMLVYQPGERFFWAENLWPAANDGGQRMDSSLYWTTVRSREDFQCTRDLWATGTMEAIDHAPGLYHYARGNATGAYHPSKVEHFTRELVYTPGANVLVVFDRVRSAHPAYRKVWLLHGVNEPRVAAPGGHSVGHGGTAYRNASVFTYEAGQGRLRVHALLPRQREVIRRGGPGWKHWTPGDELGGAWGSGRNWPLEPAQGGPLPEDPYLRAMWKTFYGDDFETLLPSNRRAVVPAAWRVEVRPLVPAKEDHFLHVLEIGDRGDARAARVELVEGAGFTGALVEGGTLALFATGDLPVVHGEVTIPDVAPSALLISGLRPDARYELQIADGRASGCGGPVRCALRWHHLGIANSAGVLHLPFHGQKNARLRVRLLSQD